MNVDSAGGLGEPRSGVRLYGGVMKTVAAISFRDNHSLSMDVDAVSRIEVSRATQIEDDLWCCELLIRSANGTIALQLLSDAPEKLRVATVGPE